MGFASYTADELRSALGRIGLSAGQTLVVHSSVMHLGRMAGVDVGTDCRHIVDVLLDTIGPDGTLAMPASNWEYGRLGVPFDLQQTPPARDLGVLPREMLRRAGVRRSVNPTFSLAILGARAEWLCAGGNGHAFGFDSAWDRLYQLDATMVCLGCDLNALSFTRYIEMRYGVPYLYNKLFTTPVVDGGTPIDVPIVSLLRYGNIPIEYDLRPLQSELRDRAALREADVGGGSVGAVGAQACFAIATECLKQDLHFFLATAPQYPLNVPPIL